MSDIHNRIEKLSPEKRRLLEMMIRRQTEEEAAGASDAAPVQEMERIEPVSEENFTDKTEVRRFYNAVNRQLNASDFGNASFFLNYGYAPNDSPAYSQIKLPDNTLNKNPTRLVLEVIGDCPVRPDDNLLDVGCGRGGTVTVFHKFFTFNRIVGMDLSSQAVAFDHKTHNFDNAWFLEGDAQVLPFRSAYFNIVTNIESSHGYKDIEAFWTEVCRVLKPGGHFLYTDLFAVDKIDDTLARLDDIGLAERRRVDITGNVLLSCDEVADTHARAYAGDNDADFMGNFLAQPNSPVYNEMKSGKSKYMIFKLKKKDN